MVKGEETVDSEKERRKGGRRGRGRDLGREEREMCLNLCHIPCLYTWIFQYFWVTVLPDGPQAL